MRYAAETTVSVARSRAAIEDVVTSYGADKFGAAFDNERSQAMVQFNIDRWLVRFVLPLPNRQSFRQFKDRWGYTKTRSDGEAERKYEQACRQRWRALLLAIKAKLEAVECGITTFEEEFLAHIVVPGTGQTVGAHLVPQLEHLTETKGVPQLPGF